MITKKQALLAIILGALAVVPLIAYDQFKNKDVLRPKASDQAQTQQNTLAVSEASAKICEITPEKRSQIDQMIKGEVAAFTFLSSPKPVANLNFQNDKGQTLSLQDFKGRALLVNLWATWCAPCREEMPALDELQRVKGGDNFQVLTINIDTRNLERPQLWLKDAGIKHLAYYSDAQAKTFQTLRSAGTALGMPVTLLVDKRGCHIGHLNGPASWASADAIKLIEAVE
jgi:thiol-disulfide isomerase/thioredoxin